MQSVAVRRCGSSRDDLRLTLYGVVQSGLLAANAGANRSMIVRSVYRGEILQFLFDITYSSRFHQRSTSVAKLCQGALFTTTGKYAPVNQCV
jgi:hypothetical protein